MRRENDNFTNPPTLLGFDTEGGSGVEPSLPGRIRPVTNWLNYSGGLPPTYENHKEMLMRE